MPFAVDELPTSIGAGDPASASPNEHATSVSALTARSTGENFHVLSCLLPKHLRVDFANVYAFCRHADDLADTAPSRAVALRRLDDCEQQLRACYAGSPDQPLFVGLKLTIDRHALPIEPFLDLLSAFRQDQHVSRYERWTDVLDYCTRSANPVGRLVLRLSGHREDDHDALRHSDATCTALQLVNFWQDVRRDILDVDRIYIPTDIANAHGLDLQELHQRITHSGATRDLRDANGDPFAAAYRATLIDLCDRTRSLFTDGRQLLPRVSRDVRPVIALFTLGGEAVLRRIAAIDYRTDLRRPRVGKIGKASLLCKAWITYRLGGK
ncbi:MAG TPA: squalene synthase HpnC [Tepidisphaeraceae bacterium]|jgi:squalene synthase HpnC|nr:squalene synthase HpnC [Tepidisphaeraceae bacterium]